MKIKVATFLLVSLITQVLEAQTIKITGSSTVYPISKAVSLKFEARTSNKILIEETGTLAGLKKFGSGDFDILNASRQMSDAEKAQINAKRIDFIEIPIAFDGITVIVNEKNTFLTQITLEELKKLFVKDRNIRFWSDLNPKYPEKLIQLAIPGEDSGTHSFFFKKVGLKDAEIREDVNTYVSGNDIVHFVEDKEHAIGFIGYGTFSKMHKKIRSVSIYNGVKFVQPNISSILNKEYEPFTRQLYIYVKTNRFSKEKKDFLNSYLKEVEILARVAGYIPLRKSSYSQDLDRINKLTLVSK